MRRVFKKGDVITRIRISLGDCLIVGKSYTVTEDEDSYGHVSVINEVGANAQYYASNFELSKNYIVKELLNDLKLL